MAILHTKRLILRPVQIDDLDDIYNYSCTPNVGPNAGWKPHESKEETLETMNAIFLNQEMVWGIAVKESGRIIGSIGLVDDQKRQYDMVKMLGYAIGEAYWGQGFMSEAVKKVIKFGFEELHLAAISAYCFPFNQRSKSIINKCNFEYEGTLQMAEKIYNGNIYDNECYLLTAQRYHPR
ncbi:MAG: GNAT family N-acetyltransferase [Syntrophomonadaceae bacterium]|jgi:putative acetyltransferase|nr:GNAT family N-acetyltransferase [Syntrophomonadaceae bacterium]